MSWDRKQSSEFIGATAKLEAAARMRHAARDAENNAPAAQGSQAIPVTVVFVLAAGLAMLAPEGFLTKIFGGGMTGIGALDRILTGAAAPGIAGDADLDRLISILVRGVAVFLAAGAPPFLASAAVRTVGKNRLNPFVACWAALIVLPLFYLLWGSLNG